MHEHGLGDLILHDLRGRFPEVPPGGSLRVRVRVSELAGLTGAALQEAMNHATEQHEAPPIQLELCDDSLLGRCPDCGVVAPVGEDLVCSGCQSDRVSLCAGETLLIEEVTICPGESQVVQVSTGGREGKSNGECEKRLG